jgi:putative SOS response-associated peptidase YedK
MCNLYSVTKGQSAIRDLFDAMEDRSGNLPSMPGVFPDYAAPIVRRDGDERLELTRARWGIPSPAFALKGKKVDRGVTNIRNTKSPHWRRWLSPSSRCLVPFSSFSEPGKSAEGKLEPVWFALGEDRPLAFFAGVWTNWTSSRKLAEGEVTCDLYGFLTTEASRQVGEVHPKAMPVILTGKAEWETWLSAPWEQASELQRPLPDGALSVIARGEKRDEV